MPVAAPRDVALGRASSGRPGPRHRTRLRLGLPLLAALAALLVVLLPSSNAVFVGRVANTGSTMGAATYFTCANAVTAGAPRFYYKLDETAANSTVTDSSGQGRNGSYVGTVTKGQPDACARDAGTAVLFNGTNAYVSYGSALQVPTTLSLEAWVKTQSVRGGVLVGFGGSATGASTTVDRVVYLTNAGKVAFGINNASKTAVVSNATVNDGGWHHVLVTLGTTGTKIYVDGVESGTGSATATTTYTGYLRVAYDNVSAWPSAPTSSFLNATVDEVAVYTTQLTLADAVSHYQAGT